MTEDETGITLSEDERRVRDAVRRLPRVSANIAARNRLRREFSTGQFTSPRPAPALPPPRWQVVLRWSPVPVAAAAVVLLALLNRGPDWVVLGATSGVAIEVGGTSIPVTEAEALAGAVERGGVVRVPEGAELTLGNGELLYVQVAGGSTVTLPAPPGRWIRRGFRGRVERGEARFMTGEDFPGRTLRLGMPVGTAEVTGTLFSVVTDGSLSRVCVVEGIAWVGRVPNTMEAIPPGMRKVMFGDTRPETVISMEPGHAADLVRFRDSLPDLLGDATDR